MNILTLEEKLLFSEKRKQQAAARKLRDPEKYKQKRKDDYRKSRDRLIIKVAQWKKDHPEDHAAQAVRRRTRIRAKVFSGYGGKCACCGEMDFRFLTLDHVDNDGFLERAHIKGGQDGCYRRAIRENFPPCYQVLCWNCNCGKRHNKGICPHKSKVRDIYPRIAF